MSTRKVHDRVRPLGTTDISKSEVARIGAGLDEQADAFRQRSPEGRYPYLWLDGKFLKVREGDRVHSMALVVATGVRETGEREGLGFDLGLSEDAAFWTSFLRSLVAHGLRLVISDAHEGLQQAIEAVLHGASWQRCRTHFMGKVLAQVPSSAQAVVAALVRMICAQPNEPAARAPWARVAESLRDRFPKAASLLTAAAEDVLASMIFPTEHWRQIHSTNPLERLNREILNRPAVLRLVGAVLMEQNDAWLAAPKRYFSKAPWPSFTNQNRGVSLLP